MLLTRTAASTGCSSSSSRPISKQSHLASLLLPAQPAISRQCACSARRGRTSATPDDDAVDRLEAEPAPAKRKGRKRKTDVEPAPTTAQEPVTGQMQPLADHEKVISIEDMTSSVELDYTDNPTLIVPSYTHQAQGHESADQPPLENFVPYSDSPGFVGSEELPAQQPPAAAPQQQQQLQEAQQLQQQQLQTQPWQLQAQQQQQQPWQDPQQQQAGLGLQVVQQQQLVGLNVGAAEAATGVEGTEEEDEDELLGYDDPPGLFDYEAGLAFAVVEPPPEQPLTYIPKRLRPQSRKQADYMLRYLSYLGDVERQEREVVYKERALEYHLAQVKESHNVYLTGKALSVVMAEIELEDAQTGNRTDSFYPTWARAEHRWYPSGRFAAYNEYIKDRLPDMIIKYAPGADQEVEFDIMDDVLLMSDDPTMPGGGAGEEDDSVGDPAAGLSIDSFMGPSMLPGAGSSELGAAFLEDVLAPAGDEELEEELLE